MAGDGIYFTKNGDEFERVSTTYLRGGTSMAYKGEVYATVTGTEIGTLSEGYVAVINSKQRAKSASDFTVHQNGRMLKITTQNQNTRPQLALFNVAGKRQKVKPTFQTDGTVSLSVSHLPPGLYVLRVSGNKESWQRKIMLK
jgi:hypothetical protein